RVLHVIAPNPLGLSGHERSRLSEGFRNLVARLRPGEALQFYVEARPVKLEQLLLDARREVAAWSGEPPAPGRPVEDPLARSRWRPGCSTARGSPRCCGGASTPPRPTPGAVRRAWRPRSSASSTPPPSVRRPSRPRGACASASPARRWTSAARAITPRSTA